MDAQELYANKILSHALYTQRLSASAINETITELRKTLDQVAGLVLAGYANKTEANAMIKSIEAALLDYENALYDDMANRLYDFAEYETGYQTALLTTVTTAAAVVKTPPISKIQAIINANILDVQPGKRGISVREAITQFTQGRADRFAQYVKDAVVAGTTNDELALALQNEFQTTQRQFKTLTRTMFNSIATEAQTAVYENNKGIMSGEYEWLSTLDSRTSITCSALDGKVFKYSDKSAPKPPAHYACRSKILPLVKDEYLLDVPTTRASEFGQVSARKDMQGWLSAQPLEYVQGVLGKTRGKLFKQGKLRLTQLVDDDFVPLTLDELKKLHPSAFK
jgi:SPP1 gp7 family putative phage head morphogenesis protein